MKKWDSGVGIVLQELPNIDQLRREEEERLKELTYFNRTKSISHKVGDEITVKFKIKDTFKSNLFYGLMFSKEKSIAQEILGAEVNAIGWNTFDSNQVIERLEEMTEMLKYSQTPEVRGTNRMLTDLMCAIRNGQLSNCTLSE